MPYPSEPGSYRVDVILQDAALNEAEQSRFLQSMSKKTKTLFFYES